MNYPQPEFASIEDGRDLGYRNWGKEVLLHFKQDGYLIKYIYIKKGHHGGLQYHRLKDESGFLVSGGLCIEYIDSHGRIETKICSPGDSYRFPSGCIHRVIAVEDSVVIEASTAHFNDRVRMEKEFNLSGFESGLPTISLDDIQTTPPSI